MSFCYVGEVPPGDVHRTLVNLQDFEQWDARLEAAKKLLICGVHLGAQRVLDELIPCLADMFACTSANLPLLPAWFPDAPPVQNDEKPNNVESEAESRPPNSNDEIFDFEVPKLDLYGPRPSVTKMGGARKDLRMSVLRALEALSHTDETNIELARQLGWFVPDVFPGSESVPVISCLLLLASNPEVDVRNEAIRSISRILQSIGDKDMIDSQVISFLLQWTLSESRTPYRKASMSYVLPLLLYRLLKCPREFGKTVDALAEEVLKKIHDMHTNKNISSVRRGATLSYSWIARMLLLHPINTSFMASSTEGALLTSEGAPICSERGGQHSEVASNSSSSGMNITQQGAPSGCSSAEQLLLSRNFKMPRTLDHVLGVASRLLGDENPSFKQHGLLTVVSVSLTLFKWLIFNRLTPDEQMGFPCVSLLFRDETPSMPDHASVDISENAYCEHEYCKCRRQESFSVSEQRRHSSVNSTNYNSLPVRRSLHSATESSRMQVLSIEDNDYLTSAESKDLPCSHCGFMWPAACDPRLMLSLSSSAVFVTLKGIFNTPQLEETWQESPEDSSSSFESAVSAYSSFMSQCIWPLMKSVFFNVSDEWMVRKLLIELLPILFDAFLPFVGSVEALSVIEEVWLGGLLDDRQTEVRFFAIECLPLHCTLLSLSPSVHMRSASAERDVNMSVLLKQPSASPQPPFFIPTWLSSRVGQVFQMVSADPDVKQRQIVSQSLVAMLMITSKPDVTKFFITTFLAIFRDSEQIVVASLLGSMRTFCVSNLPPHHTSNCRFALRSMSCVSVMLPTTSLLPLEQGIPLRIDWKQLRQHGQSVVGYLKEPILTSLNACLSPEIPPTPRPNKQAEMFSMYEDPHSLSATELPPTPAPDWRPNSVAIHIIPSLFLLFGATPEVFERKKGAAPVGIKNVLELFDGTDIWTKLLSSLFDGRNVTRRCCVRTVRTLIRMGGSAVSSHLLARVITQAVQPDQTAKAKIGVLCLLQELSDEIKHSLKTTSTAGLYIPEFLIAEIRSYVSTCLKDPIPVVRCSSLKATCPFIQSDNELRNQIQSMSAMDPDKEFRYLAHTLLKS